jgi:hypothetical protein
MNRSNVMRPTTLVDAMLAVRIARICTEYSVAGQLFVPVSTYTTPNASGTVSRGGARKRVLISP